MTEQLIAFRLSDKKLEALNKKVKDLGIDRSRALRQAIDLWLASHDQVKDAMKRGSASLKADCSHPVNRRIGIYCGVCQRQVGKKPAYGRVGRAE